MLFSWFSLLTFDWTVFWFALWHGLRTNELDAFHTRLTRKMHCGDSFNQLVTNDVPPMVPDWSRSELMLCKRHMCFIDPYTSMLGLQHRWFHSTNSSVLCVQRCPVIILECPIALFSKTGWPYPTCWLNCYLLIKVTCSYFHPHFSPIVILSSSIYFLAKHAIHCLPVYQKTWRVLGPVNLWLFSEISDSFQKYEKVIHALLSFRGVRDKR